MRIVLDHIMPIPLASIQHGEDSIWGHFVEIDSTKKTLLNASSGKGKSTFTMTTIGLRKDYSGTLSYDGRDIKYFDSDQWTEIRQRKISVVFQDLQLFPTLSVGENLLLKNQLHEVYSEMELRDKLAELGIGDKWEQQCGLLSMGQQQRVAIIRALCQPFEILLLDEPFSHLDEENTQICLKMINERCDELKSGFVLTTLGDRHGFNYDKELKL